MIRFPISLYVTFCLLCFLLSTVVVSQWAWAENTPLSPAKNPASYDITKEIIQVKTDALTTRQGLDDLVKTKVLQLYQSAKDNLDDLENYKLQSNQYSTEGKNAPDNIKKLQKDIEHLQAKTTDTKNEDFSKISLEELDQRLIIEKSKINSISEQIKHLENELAIQQSRPQLIREQTVKAQQDLDASFKSLDTAASNSLQSKLEQEAQQLELKTLSYARVAELKMLDAEGFSNPIRIELLKTQLQLLNSQKKWQSPVIDRLETVLLERRQQAALTMQKELTEAEKTLGGKAAVIQESTRKNIQYSRSLQAISIKTEAYAEQKNKIDAKTQEINADYKSAEKKISLAGLSPALGKILREQRRNLATEDEFEQQSEAIQNETAFTSLEQFKIEDRLKQLADIDVELQYVMTDVDQNLPKNQRMMIQAELRSLLINEKDVLNKLSTAYSAYLRALGDFDFAYQQMVIQAEQFAKYLDERLLWVPSSEPINLHYIVGLYDTTQWFLSPRHWAALITNTLHSIARYPFFAFFALISLIPLHICRKWAKQQLNAINAKVEKIYTDSFYHTLKALIYMLIMILPLPVAINLLGWVISSTLPPLEFNKAIGEGLQASAMPLFFIEFFYRMFAPNGIARKHFQWQSHNTNLLRYHLRWLRLIVVPSTFVINATNTVKIATYSDSFGRLALIIVVTMLMVFLTRMLHPSKGLLQHYIEKTPTGWVAKLRYVWYSVAFLIPLIIIGFAIAGYYLSALELQQKLAISLRLIFFLVVFHEMVVRWLTLINRQLALQNARQKRRAAAALHDRTQLAGDEDPVLPVDEHQIDIPTINAQTIKILHVVIAFGLIAGIWLIWKNILPAFSFLDHIELWQRVVKKNNQETYQAVTLTNVLLAGLYVFIISVSVRNFSGVMEVLVFRRLSIEPGGRYAVNQLAKYLLMALGFILVANELGGSWSQVQWLVAALSVGLGFGLQEIFANLVSGIILLFERPIRVGDTVTIGSVSGKVSRIQMRATTLIDFDQKELIVPNKTFITSQLTNWTLTDATTRIVIPISIAYGSDVEFVHSVLLKTTETTPLVLTEPAPSVIFTGFGESALNFSIRIYVGELASRLRVTHDLHIRLERTLRENNIDIPFPQQDINIRSFVKDNSTTLNHLETQ